MRKYFVDWIRNLCILFLFVFHTARVFNEDATELSFYVKGQLNEFSTILVYASSFWFMPLLFLLSGMSSFYALRSRSARAFARERTMRLLVPLVFGCLVIVPPQAYFALKFHQDYSGGYLDFLTSYFTDFADWDALTGFSPAHLWFIAFLFVIAVALLPLMARIVKHGYSPRWMRDPRLVVLGFVPLALLSFLPSAGGQNLFTSAGYFLLGFLIATSDEILDGIERGRMAYLAVALAGTAAIVAEEATVGRQSDLLATLWHYPVYWAVLLAFLGFGNRHLNRPSRFNDYFTRASFPVYIVHQTYLVAIAYYVLQATDHGLLPFAAIAMLSLGLSILTYELNRRYNPAGALFGLKTTSRKPEKAAAGQPTPKDVSAAQT